MIVATSKGCYYICLDIMGILKTKTQYCHLVLIHLTKKAWKAGYPPIVN